MKLLKAAVVLAAILGSSLIAVDADAHGRQRHRSSVGIYFGVPGYEVTGWYGICTQSKVPQPILTKINGDLHKVLAGPLKTRLEDQGITVRPTTPEEFPRAREQGNREVD